MATPYWYDKENYKVEENVLRLDVSVDDELLVNVVDALDDLADDAGDLGLLHAAVFAQHL